jgi:hypothetical protein
MCKVITVLVLAGCTTRLLCQTSPPTVCEIQQQRSAIGKKAGSSHSYEEESIIVRGRITLSPRGFFMLSEPGCSAIPIADAGKDVRPRVAFDVLKDENYEALKKVRWRSRDAVITVELEGRLDRMSKVLKGSWKSGDAGLHLSQYKYRLVLRKVVALQVPEGPP